MKVARSKMLCIRRHEGAAFPIGRENHVHMEELPAARKPWHHATNAYSNALHPRRRREHGISSLEIELYQLTGPLRIATIQVGGSELDSSQVVETTPQSKVVTVNCDLFDRDRWKILKRHSTRPPNACVSAAAAHDHTCRRRLQTLVSQLVHPAGTGHRSLV